MPGCLHPCFFMSVPSVVVSREVSSEPFQLSLMCSVTACRVVWMGLPQLQEGVLDTRLVNDGWNL